MIESRPPTSATVMYQIPVLLVVRGMQAMQTMQSRISDGSGQLPEG